MDDAKLVAASAIALAVTLFAIFAMRPLAGRLGLVDRPDERKRHRGRVPLIGGLCFFLGTIVGLLYLGYVDRFVASLLVPCALIVMTGAVDDLKNLSVRSRLVIQTCAAGMVIAATGIYLDYTGQIFGSEGLNLGLAGIPITIVAVIGLINAFNMLDGVDGLAASLAMVSIGAIMLFANVDWPILGVIVLLQVLFASLIPYLCVNLGWPDGRKIFMGDAGSTLIGFLLGWSLIFLSHRGVARLAPVDALWCVALPVMDTIAVMYRRARKGLSPFKPDRQHLHHLLQDTGCSPRVTLAAVVVASGLLTMTGYALRSVPEMLSGAVFMALMVVYVLRFQRALEWFCNALPRKARQDGAPERNSPAAFPRVAEALSAINPKPRANVLKTLCFMATPPDAIRMAPIAQQLSKDARFEAKVCVAAQPDQTPAQVLSLFGIQPDMKLRVIARPGQDQSDITSMTLRGMKRVLSEFKPDVVLIPGDTPATLATTLAAFYQQIPVVCIEPDGSARHASPNQLDEANRKITCTLASLHFTHSESAGRHLLAEGVPADRIVVTGNTAVGTLRAAVEQIQHDVVLSRNLAQRFAFLRSDSPLLLMADRESLQFGGDVSGIDQECARVDLSGAEEFKANCRFRAACRALRQVAMRRPDVDVVYPVAQRPGAMHKINDFLRACPNIHLIAPTDYLSFAYLLNHAHLVLADSGELAAEVASLGKPVMLMKRDAGHAAASDSPHAGPAAMTEHALAVAVLGLLDDPGAREALCRAASSSGHRDACECAVEALANLRHTTVAPAARPIPGLNTSPMIEALREAS